ncbi:hypothetical protein [Haloarchaeobius sp. DFWS5]|uniref:hypothetical protein n=1 Tax=Haloarchaeobius sp. DFWS5 TaxID=3446114 RepID=UPI003EB77C13
MLNETTTLTAARLGVVVTYLFTRVLGRFPRRVPTEVLLWLQVQTFVSTFTVVGSLGLVMNDLSVYRDIPSRFTLSLIIFSLALLLYAITSVPLVAILLTGVRQGLAASLGPFTFIPDVFAAIAVLILLYQSFE